MSTHDERIKRERNMLYVYIGLLIAYGEEVTATNVLRRLRSSFVRTTSRQYPEASCEQIELWAELYCKSVRCLAAECVDDYHRMSEERVSSCG